MKTIHEQIKSTIKYAYEGAYDRHVADPVDFIDRQLEDAFPSTAVAVEADDLRFLMEHRGFMAGDERDRFNAIAAKYSEVKNG